MTEQIRIRPMRPGDAGELAALEREIFPLPWSEQSFSQLLNHDYNICVVAQKDDMPIGCAVLTMLGAEGSIDKVMVSEAMRGQGIATQLLERLLAEGQKRSVAEFTLEVRVSNAAAIALYKKFGFAQEGIRPNFYEKPTEDALIMWRR